MPNTRKLSFVLFRYTSCAVAFRLMSSSNRGKCRTITGKRALAYTIPFDV